MEKPEIFQTIFLTFISACVFWICGTLFNFFSGIFIKTDYLLWTIFIFWVFSGISSLIFCILGYYPQIINLNPETLKGKYFIKTFQKIAKWSVFILLFLIFCLIFLGAVIQGQINRGIIPLPIID